jgi:hypothetical protein
MQIEEGLIMGKLFFLIAATTLLNNFLVNLEFLTPPNSQNLSLKIKVTNHLSQIKILKNRQASFKQEKIKALGNYIIEIEKWDGDKFHSVNPSADIDPVFEKPEYVYLQKGETITDTVNIDGAVFRSSNHTRGFAQGNYRLRVSFNTDEWNSKPSKAFSSWLDFKIK